MIVLLILLTSTDDDDDDDDDDNSLISCSLSSINKLGIIFNFSIVK